MAQRYAIASLAEAQSHLEHSILGPRLTECTELVNKVEGRSTHQSLGSPDDLKSRSSMTLCALAQQHDPVFHRALQRYFDGALDPLTTEKLLLSWTIHTGSEEAVRSDTTDGTPL